MDTRRAQEILQSDHTFNVFWEGDAVWIDSVDEANAIALIHDEADPRSTRNVPIEELSES